MWRLWVVLLFGAALTSCQSGGEPTATSAATPSPARSAAPTAAAVNTLANPAQQQAIERGRLLYFSQGCNVCHGEQGEGDVGPTLASTTLTFAEVRRQLRNPRGFMPAYIEDILSDDQIRDLYAFERSLPKP